MDDILYNITTTATEIMTTANSTLVPPGDVPSRGVGFITAGIAVVFFGSNFVPVKKFETGDGMFFQWVLCCAIWHGGLVVNCIRGFPQFHPLAMLGGFLWATGNICVVPIIKTIGLGKGLLVWGSLNMLAGWASGRFGLFWTTPELVSHSALNYVGMGLCLTSAIVYLFIKSETKTRAEGGGQTGGTDRDPLLPKESEISPVNDTSVIVHAAEDISFLDRMSPRKKVLIGTILAVFSGVLYGLNFTPVIYLIDKKIGSDNGLDYVFAHFSGIYATSTVYFCIYAAFRKNRPCVYPRAIIPGIISGIMWAVADCSWFVANDALSEPVSFPIVTAGPGIIGTLWGIFFKEIRGLRNLLVVGVAICVTTTGSILTGYSK